MALKQIVLWQERLCFFRVTGEVKSVPGNAMYQAQEVAGINKNNFFHS